MINVLAEGENRHRLEDSAGQHIGWIRGRAIGITGFRSEAQAMAGVVAAWLPLESVLRRHYFGWPRHAVSLERLHVEHDGAYDWVTDGKLPLARLHRPNARKGGGYAVEFVLPSYASEGVAISVAQVVANALRPLVSAGPDTSPDASPVTVTADPASEVESAASA